MPDTVLVLTVADATADRLAERAEALGLAPAQLAALILDARFFDYDDFSWIDDDLHDDAPAPRSLNEMGRPWEDVRPDFLALINRTIGKPG